MNPLPTSVDTIGTVVVELRIFRRSEKEMQYFIVTLFTDMPEVFYFWWYKTSNDMNKSVRKSPKTHVLKRNDNFCPFVGTNIGPLGSSLRAPRRVQPQ